MRIAGINVDIHATFLILLAWIALADYGAGRTAAAAIEGVLLTLAIFASVVLHEFGHALMAARFGVKTRSITLLPIGGVARLERMPDRPGQELAIAIAGPSVTAGIILVFVIALWVTGTSFVMPETRSVTVGSFLAQLMWVNVVLLVFNLLPAFPMDGGRVLRAGLATRMSYARATEIATQIGKIFALLFALLGLFVVSNPFLIVIAAFVWLSAAAEAAAAQLKATVGDVAVARAMVTDVHSLTSRLSARLSGDRRSSRHRCADAGKSSQGACGRTHRRPGRRRDAAELCGDDTRRVTRARSRAPSDVPLSNASGITRARARRFAHGGEDQ